jgi:hypothetical protein
VLLGVVEAAEAAALGQREPLQVEEHRRRDQRPGERPPARFVRAGYEAPLERAVEGEQSPPARRAPPGTARLGCRGGLCWD